MSESKECNFEKCMRSGEKSPHWTSHATESCPNRRTDNEGEEYRCGVNDLQLDKDCHISPHQSLWSDIRSQLEERNSLIVKRVEYEAELESKIELLEISLKDCEDNCNVNTDVIALNKRIVDLEEENEELKDTAEYRDNTIDSCGIGVKNLKAKLTKAKKVVDAMIEVKRRLNEPIEGPLRDSDIDRCMDRMVECSRIIETTLEEYGKGCDPTMDSCTEIENGQELLKALARNAENIADLRRQLEEAKDTIIYLVHSAGGEIRVHNDIAAHRDLKVECYDDSAANDRVFKVYLEKENKV